MLRNAHTEQSLGWGSRWRAADPRDWAVVPRWGREPLGKDCSQETSVTRAQSSLLSGANGSPGMLSEGRFAGGLEAAISQHCPPATRFSLTSPWELPPPRPFRRHAPSSCLALGSGTEVPVAPHTGAVRMPVVWERCGWGHGAAVLHFCCFFLPAGMERCP